MCGCVCSYVCLCIAHVCVCVCSYECAHEEARHGASSPVIVLSLINIVIFGTGLSPHLELTDVDELGSQGFSCLYLTSADLQVCTTHT